MVPLSLIRCLLGVAARQESVSSTAHMPRRGGGGAKHAYDDDVAEAKGRFDDDHDGYDRRQHPTSRHVKDLRQPKDEMAEMTVERLDVPDGTVGRLVGKGGATKNGLEGEYNVVIDLPARGDKTNAVYIEGIRKDVNGALARMKEIVGMATAQGAPVLVRDKKTGLVKATGKNEAAAPALPGMETIAISLNVEKFAHGLVIGTKGARLQDLRTRLATKDGVPQINKHTGVEVLVPDKADTTDVITVLVPATLKDHAVKVCREFFLFYELGQHLKGISVQGESEKGGVAGAMLADESTRGAKVKPRPEAKPAGPPAGGAAAGGGATQPQQQQQKAPPTTAAANVARAPRPPTCAFVDRCAAEGEGYTHAALPQRTA